MNGIDFIANERNRQVEEEDYDQKHDRKLIHGELALAGVVYATPEEAREWIDDFYQLWPFETKYYKPTPDDRIKELSKAGALIAAEIDRLLSEK
jgi:hypothetical protein